MSGGSRNITPLVGNTGGVLPRARTLRTTRHQPGRGTGVTMNIKILVLNAGTVAAAALLQGCETVDYMALSEQQLCMSYLTVPDYNVWQEDRVAAINARGIDCSPYAGAAQARVQANQNFENSLRALSGQAASNQSVPSYNYNNNASCILKNDFLSGVNRMCFYDCVGSTKSINVPASSICPLTVKL